MTFNLEQCALLNAICYFDFIYNFIEFEILIKFKFLHEKFAFYKALQMQIFHIH